MDATRKVNDSSREERRVRVESDPSARFRRWTTNHTSTTGRRYFASIIAVPIANSVNVPDSGSELAYNTFAATSMTRD